MNSKNIFRLSISILIPLAIGFLGSYFTATSIDTWYTQIQKPFFNPPNWIFAPVWTTLFILMGISFFLVWQKNFGKEKTKLLTIYTLQLTLNFFWSVFFFGMQNPILAFGEILILLGLIATNIWIFFKVSKIAGYLLIPYFLWVCFASLLNGSIAYLNS